MPSSAESYEARLREVERASDKNSDRLESHETICAERYKNIHDSIALMRGTLLKAAWVLVTGMAGILVKLVFFPTT